MTDRLSRALASIDRANAADPRRAANGKPFEIDHAERVTAWLERLRPEPTDLLRLAGRGQHIERWTVPRESYPAGRAGYLRWREDLKQFHARRVGDLAAAAGYSAEEIARVEALITKRALRNGDPDGHALEDALCLVFLETQFLELKSKTPDDKMRDIVLKTWRKMSPAGHTAALTLPLDPQAKTFLEKTLATPSSPSI
ncbi:MAG TPA: DUF4202 domain-containing protein [Elusimicrobiota bacterium]|nr:DUF4202 domain-containing protein [Elusimicrobiota bacterium]